MYEIVPDRIALNYDVRLEESSEKADQEQLWIDTHCGDCEALLNDDGQCPVCTFHDEYGRG